MSLVPSEPKAWLALMRNNDFSPSFIDFTAVYGEYKADGEAKPAIFYTPTRITGYQGPVFRPERSYLEAGEGEAILIHDLCLTGLENTVGILFIQADLVSVRDWLEKESSL